MMADHKLVPAPSVIRDHINHITKRWHELDIDCLLEVRLLTSDDSAVVKDVSRYKPTDEGIAQACDHIAAMNAYKLNAYVVVNPIRADAVIKAGRGATDGDIAASFFHWADADDAQAADNIKQFVGPRPTFFVLTGKQPCARPHVYWELEEPALNLTAWNITQKAIAATLKTDASVVNASRIMRVAGTVNWPKPKKLAKGYAQEVTELTIHGEESRPLVSSERMARAFVAAALDVPDGWFQVTPPSAGFNIDTGGHPPPLDRERLAIQAMAGMEWHSAVIRIVASYVSKGLNDDEIHALTQPLTLAGYTGADTAREVQAAIDGARRKGWTPEAPYTPNFDHAPAAPGSGPHIAAQSFDAPAPVASWAVQTAAQFTADFVAPEYLIDGVIQRGRIYTLTAPTGSGKTAVMLYIGTAMSRGESVCGRETEPGDVIYMAGENPDDVRSRIIATMDEQRIDPRDCRLHFIAGTFSIRQDMRLIHEAIAALPNVTLVVVDTLAAYFDGEDTNSNQDMLDFARVLRTITTASTKPAVIVPAHPVKNAAKTNLTPMGGSSLLNEVDGNLCLWKRETTVELHWQGKHRGAEFDPLMFELRGVKSEKVRDSKGRVMPTVMAVPLLEIRALEIAQKSHSIKERLILSIEGSDSLSMTQRCVDVGLVNNLGNAQKSTLSNRLAELVDEGLAKRILNNWFLTDKGNKAAEIINGGGSPVDLEA